MRAQFDSVALGSIGRLVRFGEPADFFASAASTARLHQAAVVVAFALCLAPFLAWSHPPLISTWPMEATAAVLGVLFLTPLLASSAWRDLRLPWVLVPIGLLLLVVIGQAATGRVATRGVALLWGMELLWAALLALSAARIDPKRLATAMAMGLILAGIINAALSLIQAARLPAFAGYPALFAADGLAYGFLAQRNNNADLLMLSLFSLQMLPVLCTQRLLRIVYWSLVVLFSAAAACTGSNALALYAGWAVLWTALLWRVEGSGQRVAFWRAARTFVVAIAVMAAVFYGRDAFAHVHHVAGVSVLRTLWHQGWLAILAHPVWGVGLGNTPTVFYDFAASPASQGAAFAAFHNQPVNNVHNLVLGLWLEAGLPGLVASALLIVGFAFAAWRARTPEQLWSVALLGVLGLHSMVEFPLWVLPFLGVATLLSVVALPSVLMKAPEWTGVAPVALAGVAVLLLSVVVQMNALFGTLSLIWTYPFDGRNVGENIQIFAALERLSTQKTPAAIALRPITTLVRGRFPVFGQSASEMAQQSARMGQLMRLMPSGSVPYVDAELLALSGKDQQAVLAAQRAVRAQPGFSGVAAQSLQSMRNPALDPVIAVFLKGDQRANNAPR